MGKKITASITIDSDLWELAKIMLPCSRSNFIEQSILTYINTFDEIEELEKEIIEEKKELQAKEQKLKDLKEARELRDRNQEQIKKAMKTVYNIAAEHGAISIKQINNIASINGITNTILEHNIKKEGIRITKYTMEYK